MGISLSTKMKLKLLLVSLLLLGVIAAEQELNKNDNEIVDTAATELDQPQDKANDFFFIRFHRRRHVHRRRRHHNPCQGWINNSNNCNRSYRRTVATCNRGYSVKVAYKNKLHKQLLGLRKQLKGWNQKVKRCRWVRRRHWCGVRRRHWV